MSSDNQEARKEIEKAKEDILGSGKTGVKGRLEAAQDLAVQVTNTHVTLQKTFCDDLFVLFG